MRPAVELGLVRDAARIYEVQGVQSTKIENIERDVKEMQIKLDKVVSFVDQTKGGYTYLWSVILVASLLGTIVGSFVTYWKVH